MLFRLPLALLLGLFAATVTAQPWPAPVAALEDHGLEIIEEFDAPAGLTGYAARAGGRPVAVYLLPDGEHVVVGTLLNAQGNELTSSKLGELAQRGQAADGSLWPRLESESHWITDGDPKAERVIYVFTDPNCPYCHKFWTKSRPWIESGNVQLRHIPVGMIKPSSPGKAAAILASKDPEAALTRNERNFDNGGIDPLDPIPDRLAEQLETNQRLMENLNIYGTPGIIYRDQEGTTRRMQGLPSDAMLRKILGPR